MRESLEHELIDYVDDIIADQIAALLPEELDKVLQPVVEAEIRALFEDQSV